jgi:hypothetical protein
MFMVTESCSWGSGLQLWLVQPDQYVQASDFVDTDQSTKTAAPQCRSTLENDHRVLLAGKFKLVSTLKTKSKAKQATAVGGL